MPLALATADGKAVAILGDDSALLPDRSVRDRNGLVPSILRQPKAGWHAVTSAASCDLLAALTGAAPEPQALAEAFDAFADRCVRCADVAVPVEAKVEAEVKAEAVDELAAEMEELAVESPPPAPPPPPPELDLEAEEAPEEESDDEVVVMAAEQPAVEAAGEAADPYDFLGPKVEKKNCLLYTSPSPRDRG